MITAPIQTAWAWRNDMPYESPVNQIHISLDIETLGIGPGHKILSIGMTEMFTPINPRQFYVEIDRKQQDHYFLREDSDTIAWWAKQPIPMPAGTCHIVDALHETSEWIKQIVKDKIDLLGDTRLKPYIWAKSPSFDCAMLRDIYRRIHQPVPWDFRHEMDVRTACLIAGINERDIESKSTPHNALVDSEFQSRVVYECYRSLGLL